jgi:hypothetical protein
MCITMPSYRIPEGLGLLLWALCATVQGASAGSGAGYPAGGYPPGIELPAGEQRELVLATCTRCHDLRGLPAYKGYWNRAQWRDMVDTMKRHGAVVGPAQAEAITDYLNKHFGRTEGSNQGKNQ